MYIYPCTFPKFTTRVIVNILEAIAICQSLFCAIYMDYFILPLDNPMRYALFSSLQFMEMKTEPQKMNLEENQTAIK